MLFHLQDRRYGKSRKGGSGIWRKTWNGAVGESTGKLWYKVAVIQAANIRGKIKRRKERWVRHSEETLKMIQNKYN
jgi:hypothetical protein